MENIYELYGPAAIADDIVSKLEEINKAPRPLPPDCVQLLRTAAKQILILTNLNQACNEGESHASESQESKQSAS